MKKVLIIFYELTNPVMSLQALTKRIKDLGPWARLGNSAYLIVTENEPVQVRDYLWQVMQPSDRIYIGNAPPPSAWNGLPNDVSDWIRKYQK